MFLHGLGLRSGPGTGRGLGEAPPSSSRAAAAAESGTVCRDLPVDGFSCEAGAPPGPARAGHAVLFGRAPTAAGLPPRSAPPNRARPSPGASLPATARVTRRCFRGGRPSQGKRAGCGRRVARLCPSHSTRPDSTEGHAMA